MPNPFSLDLQQGTDPRALQGFSQALAGLGQVTSQKREKEAAIAQEKQAQEGMQAAIESGDPAKIAEFMRKNPNHAASVEKSMGFEDEMVKTQAVDFMKGLLSSPEDQWPAMFKERIETLDDQRRDPSDTIKVMQSWAENPAQGKKTVETLLAVSDQDAFDAYQEVTGGGGEGGASTKAFAPITIVNPETKEKRLVTPIFNPKTNKAELSPFDMPKGFEISKETAAEERAAEVVQTGEKEKVKVGAKSIAQRNQGYIDSGVEAADSMSGIGDAIALLDLVGTGGYEAAALRAKQTLGIESADEGELANALGLAVLSQLKPIFGSAFTSEEGARLERLSAGFGKSPEANKRILKKQLKIAERAARRAIRAAKESGDTFTENEIKHGLYSAKGGELMEDAEGNKAYKMPDGSYKEVE